MDLQSAPRATHLALPAAEAAEDVRIVEAASLDDVIDWVFANGFTSTVLPPPARDCPDSRAAAERLRNTIRPVPGCAALQRLADEPGHGPAARWLVVGIPQN